MCRRPWRRLLRAAAPAATATAPCGPQYVTKTVCVPEMVTENRTVTVTECQAVTKTCKVPCCEMVPVTKTVQRCCTVMVPQQSMRTECYCEAIPYTRQVTECYEVAVPTTRTVQGTYTVCVPVYTHQTEQCTVMVPSCETRHGVRCETHCVPVKETCMKCVDKGHWQDQPVPACGPCQPTQTCRCWVPNWVNESVEVTVQKPETVEVPYTYQVTVCKPVLQTHTVQVCHYENQVHTCTRKSTSAITSRGRAPSLLPSASLYRRRGRCPARSAFPRPSITTCKSRNARCGRRSGKFSTPKWCRTRCRKRSRCVSATWSRRRCRCRRASLAARRPAVQGAATACRGADAGAEPCSIASRFKLSLELRWRRIPQGIHKLLPVSNRCVDLIAIVEIVRQRGVDFPQRKIVLVGYFISASCQAGRAKAPRFEP